MLLSEIQTSVFTRILTDGAAIITTLLDREGDGTFKPGNEPYAIAKIAGKILRARHFILKCFGNHPLALIV